MAQARTATTVPVSIRFVLSVASANKAEDFDVITLITCAKSRVSFLRSASVFVLGSSAHLASARRDIRKSIAAPKTPSLRVAAEDALATIAAVNAKLSAIGVYFLEVPALSGQEIGKDADGNSVTGADLANALFGSVTVAQSKSLLRAVTSI
jgi:hypothetical protein